MKTIKAMHFDSVLDPSNNVEQLSIDPKMMSIGRNKLSTVLATTKSFAVREIANGKMKCPI